jgi:hypothetical protein
MPDCNTGCTRKYYVATYANKIIPLMGLASDGGAPPPADKAKIEADLQAKLALKYPLPPGLKAGPSGPNVVAGRQCPAAAGPFLGCRCIMPKKPPAYPKDYVFSDPNHEVTTDWTDGGGTKHTITAKISVDIAVEEGTCEPKDPEKVLFLPGTETVALKRRRNA